MTALVMVLLFVAGLLPTRPLSLPHGWVTSCELGADPVCASWEVETA